MKTLARDADGYYTDGSRIRLPSVTTVINDILRPYECLNNLEVLERAAEYGKSVHSMIHLYCLGVLHKEILDIKLQLVLDEWMKFCYDYNFIPREDLCECVVANHKLGYAGTFDVMGLIEGKLVLIDIKTRAYSALTDPLQTAAYCEAYKEQYKSKANIKRLIVSLLPGKKYNTTLLTDSSYTNDLNVFRSVLAAWNWRKLNK